MPAWYMLSSRIRLCVRPSVRLSVTSRYSVETTGQIVLVLAWYDTIRDAILTCARKPTWVTLIYRTEPTTKKSVKTEKLKSKKRICSEVTVNCLGESMYSVLKKKGRLRWGWFAEKEGFKSGVKEWVGDGILIIISRPKNVSSMTTV